MTLSTTVAPRTAVRPTRDTFLAICMPYERDLFAMAMRYTHSNADAADLVQETLMRAMTAWERFEAGSNARAWLQRILTNTFINGYRKRRRHQRFATECPGDARQALHGTDLDYAQAPVTAHTSEELGDEVTAALATLGPEYLDVVVRADLNGEKYRDIANALALPIGTVMSRLFRARRHLEALLAPFAAQDYGFARAA